MYIWLKAILILAIWWLAMGAIGTIITWTNPHFKELYFGQMDDYVDEVLIELQHAYGPFPKYEAKKYVEFGYKYVAPFVSTGRGAIVLIDAIRAFVLP